MKPVAVLCIGLVLLTASGIVAAADATTESSDEGSSQGAGVRPLQRLANQLPARISDGLDIDGWVWLADLQNNAHHPHNYYDALVSLSITKSFDQRFAVSGEGNFIDANGITRPELEQGFVTAKVSDGTRTLVTVGKFNANFGIEARDFWDRRTGTTSLLFNAQPQDLIGAMVTQPLGDSGVVLRPFITANFQGAYDFNQAPSAGLMAEYKPNDKLDLAVTNWVGPGILAYGGRPLRPAFSGGGYGEAGDSVVENWQGPSLYATRGSTLYFLQAKASWRPIPEFTLATEYVFARTGTHDDNFGWHGWMVLADYELTDRLHVFGRYSWLNDHDWLITGVFQSCSEVSGGLGYELFNDVELRGEYRHDFSNVTPDFDSVSLHLTFAF